MVGCDQEQSGCQKANSVGDVADVEGDEKEVKEKGRAGSDST